MTKHEIRREIFQQRDSMTPEEVREKSEKVCLYLEEYTNDERCKTVMVYLPTGQGDGRSRYLHARHDARRRLFDGILLRVGTLLPQPHERCAGMMTGGVAKNEGVRRAIEEKIGEPLILPEEPQICGALGAALIAWEG